MLLQREVLLVAGRWLLVRLGLLLQSGLDFVLLGDFAQNTDCAALFDAAALSDRFLDGPYTNINLRAILFFNFHARDHLVGCKRAALWLELIFLFLHQAFELLLLFFRWIQCLICQMRKSKKVRRGARE